MNKELQQKIHYSILDTAREAVKIQTPSIPDLQAKFDAFLYAVYRQDTGQQAKAVKSLIAGLVKWQVENV